MRCACGLCRKRGYGRARVCRALKWVWVGVKPIRACLKQFMVCLEATWFVAALHSTPMHDPGLEEFQRPVRACVCKGASALPCLLSCCCWRRRSPAVQQPRLRAAPPPGACPPESPWCRPVLAARRACQWRRGAWSRNFCNPTWSCARRAYLVNTVERSKHELGHLFQLQLWFFSRVLTGEPRGRRSVPSL